MVINGREMSNSKRRRAERQKPRSDATKQIMLKGLADNQVLTIGETQYAYKIHTIEMVHPTTKEIHKIGKYQFVKV